MAARSMLPEQLRLGSVALSIRIARMRRRAASVAGRVTGRSDDVGTDALGGCPGDTQRIQFIA
jgi:hypothetical protein